MIAELLDTAQELVESTTPETRTHRIDVLAEWLHTLLVARHPDARAERIALTDPATGDAVEEVRGSALLTLRIVVDGVAQTGERLLSRPEPLTPRR